MPKNKRWPEKVLVAGPKDIVDIGTYFTATNRPCCAYGWFCASLGLRLPSEWPEGKHDFETAYRQVFLTHYDIPDTSAGVITLNDSKCQNGYDRKLIYNAAMARIGYVVGQDEAALELVNKAEKRFGKFEP